MISMKYEKEINTGEVLMVISLGSNCGDRYSSVASAIEWLSSILRASVCSEIYETPPVGHNGSNYMNAVICGYSCLSVSSLESHLKEYEKENGRTSEARASGKVPIDLDIVIADNIVLRQRDWELGFFQIGWKEVVGKLKMMSPFASVARGTPIEKESDAEVDYIWNLHRNER